MIANRSVDKAAVLASEQAGRGPVSGCGFAELAGLYASSPDDLIAVIRALDKKLDRVMLVGHNPEFTDLAHRLSSEIIDMPTSAVAKFDFDTKAWSDVGEVEPAKAVLDYPKK